MIPPPEIEDVLEARAVEIERLIRAASQAPDAAKLAQLRTCLETGAELQQQLTQQRNQVSSDLHHAHQMALTLRACLEIKLSLNVSFEAVSHSSNHRGTCRA